MSVAITARVFWTKYPDIGYFSTAGKLVKVSETSAKITMLAIGDSADDFGENSWNSLDTLAIKTGLERRSVMRVTRALIAHKYISVAGLSVYGTNNFKINLDLLGQIPTRRAKNGRPAKTSDSTSKTSDSTSKTSDSTSPDPSLIRPNPDIDIVIEAMQNNGIFPSSMTADHLATWREIHTDARIIQAVQKSKGKNERYIDAVLRGWEKDGYPLTREERIAAAKERKPNGNSNNSRPDQKTVPSAADQAAAERVLARQRQRAASAGV